MAEFSFYEKFVQQYGLDRAQGVVNVEYVLKMADKILSEVDRIIESKATDTIPDYAKMESVNRIPGNGGTWTVDRHGFVFCFIYNNSQNVNSAGFHEIKIDGYAVAKAMYNTVWGEPTVVPHAVNGVFRVKPGDIIQLKTEVIDRNDIVSYYNCQFIPPKLVSVSIL
jgi:hypothetical protein